MKTINIKLTQTELEDLINAVSTRASHLSEHLADDHDGRRLNELDALDQLLDKLYDKQADLLGRVDPPEQYSGPQVSLADLLREQVKENEGVDKV